jgi:ribosome-dependent ATPase
MSVLVATAYMEEAERFDWLVAMDAGRVLATGTPAELLRAHRHRHLEAAFIALLPEEKKRGHRAVVEIPPLRRAGDDIAIEARDLTMRFGDFVAVDQRVLPHPARRDLRLPRLQRLRQDHHDEDAHRPAAASEGEAWLFGSRVVDPRDIATRRRVGYMSQASRSTAN